MDIDKSDIENEYIVEKINLNNNNCIIKPDYYIEKYWFILKIFIIRLSSYINENYNNIVKELSKKFNKYQEEESYIIIITDIRNLINSLIIDYIKKYNENIKEESKLLIKNIERWNICLYNTHNNKLLLKYGINPLNHYINIHTHSIDSLYILYVKLIEKCNNINIPLYNSINNNSEISDEIIIKLINKLIPDLIKYKKINLLEMIDNNTNLDCKNIIIDIILINLEKEEKYDEIRKLYKMNKNVRIKTLYKKYNDFIIIY